MGDLTALPHALDRARRTCRAVVETSQGERGKYAYSPDLGAFELKRLLPAGMSFPLDFGFVPSTKAEDGDALDIMVINDAPIPRGVVVAVRLIGVIEAEQTEDGKTYRNDRLVGVAATSLIFATVKRFEDLADDFVTSLTDFWTQYERLRGVGFKVLSVRDAAAAVEAVLQTAKGDAYVSEASGEPSGTPAMPPGRQ